jgi:hypothetical protein
MSKKYLGVSTYISLGGMSSLLDRVLYKFESKIQDLHFLKYIEHLLRALELYIWSIQKKKVIECFGDSHARVFRKLNTEDSESQFRYRTTFVRGASARSFMSFSSKTNARNIFEKRLVRLRSYSELFFLAGEVDCGATFWLKKKTESDLNETLFISESVERYALFLTELSDRGFKIFVFSVPLPILNDKEASNNIVGVRKSLTCSQSDVTRLVRLFNMKLSQRIENSNIKYIDLTIFITDSKSGIVDASLKSAKEGDHHYDRNIYAKRISSALNKKVRN